jgi:hypothetical protein
MMQVTDIKLTPAEIRLIQAYRAMPENVQRMIYDVMIATAKDKGGKQNKSHRLRLIAGGRDT